MVLTPQEVNETKLREITNRNKRQQYAKHVTLGESDLHDNSKFNIFGSDGGDTVWRKVNEDLKEGEK